MWQGKTKALTFSYDDGVMQDVRFIDILNKYGLKATFNLNSGLLGRSGELLIGEKRIAHNKVRPQDVRQIYQGHEIAAHTLTHPRLNGIDDDAEIIRQVEEDRLALSELAGYEVVGMAYPCGGVNFDERVIHLIKNNTGIKYARTTVSTYSFAPQNELFAFNPTVHHFGDLEGMMRLGKEFLALEAKEMQIFYVWGHAYELDVNDGWAAFDEFCKMMSGKKDIFYGTNKEVLL